MEREEGLEVARRSGIAGSGAEPGRSFPCLRFPEGRRSLVTPGGWVLGVRTQGTRCVFSSRGGWQKPHRLPVLPEGCPLPVPQFPRQQPPLTALLVGMPGQSWRGKGGLLPGAASGPAEAAWGTVNTPPPLFKPLPVVRRAPGVRTCVWAGAGTSLKAPRGPSRSWEGAVAGRGARAAPERVCAGGPSSGSVGPRLGAGRVEGWPGCSIPSSGCGGEGRREGEWRRPPGKGNCSPSSPGLPRVREDARYRLGSAGALPRGPGTE